MAMLFFLKIRAFRFGQREANNSLTLESTAVAPISIDSSTINYYQPIRLGPKELMGAGSFWIEAEQNIYPKIISLKPMPLTMAFRLFARIVEWGWSTIWAKKLSPLSMIASALVSQKVDWPSFPASTGPYLIAQAYNVVPSNTCILDRVMHIGFHSKTKPINGATSIALVRFVSLLSTAMLLTLVKAWHFVCAAIRLVISTPAGMYLSLFNTSNTADVIRNKELMQATTNAMASLIIWVISLFGLLNM